MICKCKQGTNVAHNVRGGLLIDLTIVAIALLLGIPYQCHSSSLTSHNGMSVQ